METITWWILQFRDPEITAHDLTRKHCIEFKYYADGIHTFGDTSAFVNPAGQLFLIAINSGLLADIKIN